MTVEIRFHHVGHVVRDLAAARRMYEKLTFFAEGPVTFDPIQRVNVQFIAAGGTRIELIEPVGEGSPVARLAARGGGLAHLCYAVQSIDDASTWFRNLGFLPISNPAPATAFDGRRVAFLMSEVGQLFELVEDAP